MITVTHLSEDDLIAGLQARDEATIEQFLERYWARCYRLAYQFTSDPGSAEDVAQEAVLQTLRSIDTFEAGRPLRPWVFRILENTARKHLRAARRRTSYERADRRRRDRRTAEVKFERGEEVRLVRDHLRRLSPKQRVAISLRYLEDLSLGEMASVLGCPEGTVSSRIRLGLDSLRRSLQPALGLAPAALVVLMPSALEAAEVSAPPSVPELVAELTNPPVPLAPSAHDLVELSEVAEPARLLSAANLSAGLVVVALAAALGSALLSTDPPTPGLEGQGVPVDAIARGWPAADGTSGALGSGGGEERPGEAPLEEQHEGVTPRGEASASVGDSASAGDSAAGGDRTPSAADSEAAWSARVTDAAGAPVAGAEVAWKRLGPRDEGRGLPVPFWSGLSDRLLTDRHGRVALPESLFGSGVVLFARRGLSHARSARLEPSSQSDPVELTLLEGTVAAAGVGGLLATVRHGRSPLVGLELDGLLSGDFFGNGRSTSVGFNVTTDDQGRFSLHELPPGRYSGGVSDEALGSIALRFEVHEGRITSVQLEHPRGVGSLAGRVVRSGGLAPGKVTLVLAGEGVAVQRELSVGPDGTWRAEGLIPGNYTLVAASDGFAPVEVSCRVPGIGAFNAPDLVLGLGATVRGVALAACGLPYDTWATLSPAGNQTLETMEWARCDLDADGRFEVRGVPPGRYRLKVRVGTGKFWTLRDAGTIEVGEADQELGERRTDHEPHAAIAEGRVVDPAGNPVAGAKVQFSGQSPRFAVVSDAEGCFKLNRATDGPYAIAAAKGARVSPLVEVSGAHGEQREITLRLASGGTISGRISLPPEEVRPAAGLARERAVSIYMSGVAHPFAMHRLDLSANDSFSVGGLPPGRYRVVVHQAYADVDVEAGAEARVELSLREAVESIRVRMRDFPGRVPAWGVRAHWERGHRGGFSRSDQAGEGEYVLRWVERGLVTVQVIVDDVTLFRDVVVEGGGAKVEFAWPAPSQLGAARGSCKLPESATKERVFVVAEGDGWRFAREFEAVAAGELEVEVPALPQGRYRVWARVGRAKAPDDAGVSIDVRAGATVDAGELPVYSAESSGE